MAPRIPNSALDGGGSRL